MADVRKYVVVVSDEGTTSRIAVKAYNDKEAWRRVQRHWVRTSKRDLSLRFRVKDVEPYEAERPEHKDLVFT